MASRTEYSPLGDWWWTVDRLILAAIAVLMLAGLVLSLAASPPVALRMQKDPFFFVNRQVMYLIPAVLVLLATSLLSLQQIRRLSMLVFVASLVLVVATILYGAELKGARRWISLFGLSIQPSEFLKPSFVIVIAWLFGESTRRPEMPANSVAVGLLLLVVSLMVAAGFRPDHADPTGLGRVVLHGRDASRVGGRACGHCGARGRLFHRSLCDPPDQRLHRPEFG
jgi:cell division protein FtsW